MWKVKVNQFSQTLEEALKHYQDAGWLGDGSPLATAYFLGEHLTSDAISATGRGRALQKLLVDATNAIAGKYAERYQTILREYYFQERPAAVVWDEIGLTKNSFHLSRNAAIAALEAVLVTHLQPALRLEQPPLPVQLVERERSLAHCRMLLEYPKTVALVGPGGIGKTALAAHLVQALDRPVFWYTVRPGLNDQVESLLFALALFAHRHGVSPLWLELTTIRNAGQSQGANERMLSALRYVLSQLDPTPILCFDGLDELQPVTQADHQAFSHCINSLRGLAPMLTLGQQMPIEADEYVTLSTLSPAGVTQLLLEQQGKTPVTLRREFHALTQGNPRLLKLCLAALASGETVEDLHQRLLASPALDLLFSQTMLRLPQAERQLLMALSVFRGPVPLQPWQTPAMGPALNSLIGKGFLQPDRAGGVELPLVYRHLVYRNLEESIRRQLHRQAAALRSSSGAYTATAYHLVQSGQPEAALALWRERQHQEVAQGQATAALELFRTVQSLPLAPVAQEQSALICAQLQYLTGQNKSATVSLRAVLGKTAILAVEAGELIGVMANDQSEFEEASRAFQRSLAVAEGLVEVRMARLYKGRAWMHLRQREIDQAERELSYAQVEIETMRGNLALDRCAYAQAAAHYRTARQLAESLDAIEAVGKCSNNLAGVALFQGRFEEAIRDLALAIAAYERIGKVDAMAGCRITLAVAHNQAGDHTVALTVLAEALDLLSARGEILPWQQALIAQAQAEAYLGLGDWVQTEACVKAAIAAEEITVLPDAYRVYGTLCLQRDEDKEAEQWLLKSLTLAQTNEDRLLTAYAWRALAQLYQIQVRLDEMIAAQAAAVDLFSRMNLPHEVEHTRQALQPEVHP